MSRFENATKLTCRAILLIKNVPTIFEDFLRVAVQEIKIKLVNASSSFYREDLRNEFCGDFLSNRNSCTCHGCDEKKNEDGRGVDLHSGEAHREKVAKKYGRWEQENSSVTDGASIGRIACESFARLVRPTRLPRESCILGSFPFPVGFQFPSFTSNRRCVLPSSLLTHCSYHPYAAWLGYILWVNWTESYVYAHSVVLGT